MTAPQIDAAADRACIAAYRAAYVMPLVEIMRTMIAVAREVGDIATAPSGEVGYADEAELTRLEALCDRAMLELRRLDAGGVHALRRCAAMYVALRTEQEAVLGEGYVHPAFPSLTDEEYARRASRNRELMTEPSPTTPWDE